jgi:hypothetical protein
MEPSDIAAAVAEQRAERVRVINQMGAEAEASLKK